MVKIIPYQYIHQSEINNMMSDIALEFDENIFAKPSNDVTDIPDNYWLAMHNNQIIGTIALIIKSDYGILKKMMLKKEFRGKELGIAKSLLETLVNWCKNHHIPKLYLGTMTQFKAAQSFYSNNGFIEISEDKLPENFLNNPLDNVFFVRDIKSSSSGK